jgi:Fe-S-cluster containining protein
MFELKQFVKSEVCLKCQGCCRYASEDSNWTVVLLAEEKQAMGIEKINLVPYEGTFFCSFLNLKDNHCIAYANRPLECKLYPFLFNRTHGGLYLAVDLKCPFAREQLKSVQFREYCAYLISVLEKSPFAEVLKTNLDSFQYYPEKEIFNLVNLKIQ